MHTTHICTQLTHKHTHTQITGAPELTVLDKKADPHYLLGASTSTADAERFARYRFTESVLFNSVLNQEPSPNMRAKITFVEPSTISVAFGSEVETTTHIYIYIYIYTHTYIYTPSVCNILTIYAYIHTSTHTHVNILTVRVAISIFTGCRNAPVKYRPIHTYTHT